METVWCLGLHPALTVEGCGIFVSPGSGRHEDRTLDNWELILVERGRLCLAVHDVDYDLGVGDWIIIPAGVRHYGTRDFPPMLRFAWMHFLPEPGHGLSVPYRGTLADPAPISALIRRLLDHRASPRRDPTIAALHLGLILAELAIPAVAESAKDELAARAHKLIRLRFPESHLTPAVIAKALGVSTDHLGRCFRAAFGIPVLVAINTARVQEAKRLLAVGSLSVAEAAKAAGFKDAQWCRRLFQRDTGVSPRAWRRLHARGHVNRR
jgi:AraC-like DNA-binding protein